MNFEYLRRWMEGLRVFGIWILFGTALSFWEVTSASDEGGPKNRIGGFVELWASLHWVGAYSAWHDKDGERIRRELNLVTPLNPESLFFWLNGARMVGYDLAAWRRESTDSPARHQTINQEQFSEALAFLQRGQAHHPDHSAFPIKEAVLAMRLTGDFVRVEDALRRASGMSDYPKFVPRVRAEVLIRLDRWILKLRFPL